MSKQSTAKDQQGYQAKPVFPMCSNCAHYSSELEVINGWTGKDYSKEVNVRCGIGGFAIKKQGTCQQHEPKR